jgi:hypothetical protein
MSPESIFGLSHDRMSALGSLIIEIWKLGNEQLKNMTGHSIVLTLCSDVHVYHNRP